MRSSAPSIPFNHAARLRRMACMAALLVCATTARHAQALDPGVTLAGYHHTSWTAKDGAPGPITTIAQTRDGWLWLGTPSGLYRFDGVKFSRFVALDGKPLPGSHISNLFAQPDGRLIVGLMGGGLLAIDQGRVTVLATRGDMSAVVQTELDADGSLWVAAMNGLFRITHGKLTKLGAAQGFPAMAAFNVVLDPYQRLWVSDPEHQYLLDRRTGKLTPAGLPGQAEDIIRAPGGQVWREHDSTWQLLPMPPATPLLPQTNWRAPSASAGTFDHDGNHWAVRCPVGLCRTLPGRFAGLDSFDPKTMATEHLDQPWQLSSLDTNVVFEDRENNIWVGTNGGLDRFRNNSLVPVPLPPGGILYEVVRNEAGQAQLNAQMQGHLFLAGATTYGPVRTKLSSAAAGDGGLLVADEFGVHVTKNGATRLVPYPSDAAGKTLGNAPAILMGNTNNFWLSLTGVGLFNFADDKWTPATAHGLPMAGTCCIATDPHGATWFGYRDGNLVRLQAGTATRIAAGTAGDVGAIRFIDASHELVIAGDEAMAVRLRGQFRRLHASDPELLAGVSGIIVTANGDRWINGRKGAVHVTATAWADAMARPDQIMQATVFDVLDGYPGSAQNVNALWTTTQSADGKLWFVGTSGVVYLDPARLHRNAVPPTVDISGLNVAEARVRADGSVTLPAGTHTLRLDYTALSLAKPERVHFRYQLDGVDTQWQNAGTRRSVVYTNLGPGDYRFKVTAANEDGVESSGDTSLRFTIAPALWQTGWFKALCVALAASLLLGAHRWRMRRLAARYWERFQERLAERERIARTLHDNVIQNFQSLLLFFQLHSDKLPAGDAARTSMDGLLTQAATVMSEAREEITGLRDHGNDPAVDIGHALATFGAELEAQFGPRFALVVTDGTQQLTPFARNEIHAIGREALFNAYQHAHPTHVEVALGRTRGAFVLSVRDDGCGMDPGAQRAGHWGLTGMRERARGLGGTLTFQARRDGGTEVILRVPAHRIDGSATRRFAWLRRRGTV